MMSNPLAAAITVRPPVPADGFPLGRVHARAWRRAYRGLMAPEFLAALDERASGEAWHRRLVARAIAGAEPGVDLLVAESPHAGGAGEVVGMAAVGPDRADPTGGQGELWMINVAPEAWGSGAGPRLLGAAVERLEDRGFSSAVLWVLAGNRRARRFYEREGWTDEGVTRLQEIGGRTVAERRYARPLGATPSRN
jgi:ribosomal protein S18 acetylase RimI-like enzyme